MFKIGLIIFILLLHLNTKNIIVQYNFMKNIQIKFQKKTLIKDRTKKFFNLITTL